MRTGFFVLLAILVILTILTACGKQNSEELKQQVVEATPGVVAIEKPTEKPFMFKCGNPKDLVPGTRLKQEDSEDGAYGLPAGALGTIMSVYGTKACPKGWVVLYDNYPSQDADKSWCSDGRDLTIISQPRCEP